MFKLTDYTEVLETITNKFPCAIEDIDFNTVWNNTSMALPHRYPINMEGELMGYVRADDEVLANRIILLITSIISYNMEEK